MKSVLALTRYGSLGASSRVRFALYEEPLRQAGYSLTLSPFFDDEYLRNLYAGRPRSTATVAAAFRRRLGALRGARNFDLLWIEKELFPFAPGFVERLARRPYVVDFDDAIFHNYDQSSNPAVRALLANKLDALLQRAAAVTAGNRYLADYAAAHGARDILILPTVVDTGVYRPHPAGAAPSHDLLLGWIGSPATRHLLQNIVPVLNEAARQVPLRLVTVGIAPLDDATFPVIAEDWTPERETELLAQIDAGIMPLTDSPFERGKCGYKLIQYMALGKPVIASDVGVNGEIVTPEVGHLARSDAEWIAAIKAVAADRDKSRAMGVAARARAESHYSLNANAPRLIELFDRITARQSPR